MRVVLLCSEPMKESLAGIGIRYLELARALVDQGLGVDFLFQGDGGAIAAVGARPLPYARGQLKRLVGDCQAAVIQGHLANDFLHEVPDLPTAVDLYDPFLVENFSYWSTLGREPYLNDLASWKLQLGKGDFFLCSCEQQRAFYLGFLTHLGRVEPEHAARDPDFRELIDVVPFAIPTQIPEHRPWLEPSPRFRILFGGVYDWYDPLTLLEGLERADLPPWELIFSRNPNPSTTPQQRLLEVEGWCQARGWWGERVVCHDWVPAERRFDLLRDVGLLASPHRPSLETQLSLRTRYLEALAVATPVLASRGGSLSELLAEHGAGWLVPPGDAQAVAGALEQIANSPEEVRSRARSGLKLAGLFSASACVAPLTRFFERLPPTKPKGWFSWRK